MLISVFNSFYNGYYVLMMITLLTKINFEVIVILPQHYFHEWIHLIRYVLITSMYLQL